MLNSIEYSVEYKSYPSEVLVDINRIGNGDCDDSSVQNGITKDRNIYLYLLVIFCTIDFMLFIVHRNLSVNSHYSNTKSLYTFRVLQ